MMQWKRVPPALLFGLAIDFAFGIARVVHYHSGVSSDDKTWDVLEQAFALVTIGLIASGLFELANRLPGRAALAARIAAIANLAQLAWYATWLVIELYQRNHDGTSVESVVRVVTWLPCASSLVIAVGLGVASRRVALAIAAALVSLVAVPIPPLESEIWSLLKDCSPAVATMIRMSTFPLFSIALAAAAYFACDSIADAPVARADRAFEQASRALWLRLIAALSLLGLMALIVGAELVALASLLKFVMVAAQLVDAAALIWLARAALGLSRANVSRWLVLPAAAGALWAAGMLLVRAFYIGLAFYTESSHGYGSTNPLEIATIYPTLVPLVAAAAVGLLLVAVTQLARARNLDDLRENATVRTGAFVVLELGALFIMRNGIEHATSEASGGMFLIAVLAAAGASVYALVIAAKLCGQAARVVATDPAGLPAATVVKGGSR